jgi:hypothetical protein
MTTAELCVGLEIRGEVDAAGIVDIFLIDGYQ